MQTIQITTPGIKKALRKYDYKRAIAEYIWNGFDARATWVDIAIQTNEIGSVTALQIRDNGYGIDHRKLSSKFVPFFESDKELDPNIQRNTSTTHGKNGVGRLTFFTFANQASWHTTYKGKEQNIEGNFMYTIGIDANILNTYSDTPPAPTSEPTGTVVSFYGIKSITENNFKKDFKHFISQEFCWFLELNSSKNFYISINGVPLNYAAMIGEQETLTYQSKGTSFDIKYIRWNDSLNNEFSRFYYIGSDDEEKFKETTRLNLQGDKFYHSIYIKSDFFNLVKRPDRMRDHSSQQLEFPEFTKENSIFSELISFVQQYLRGKRKPFLVESTQKLIAEFKKDGVFPSYGDTQWDRIRQRQLELAVKSIYLFEPRVFSSLNMEQKKIMTHLLDLIINSDESDKLTEIISEIIKLSKEERAEFASILQTNKMSSIIKTIKLIEDRFKVIDQLKQLVFNSEIRANERDHLQKFVEQHYWIFGEQYHLITAAEPKFEEALKRYVYKIRGELTNRKIDHPDKQKEMDIFMIRQLLNHNTVNCVVVELKHPNVKLGEKELSQVKRYWNVIQDQDEFNANNNYWEFYLVGNSFDSTKYIQGEITNAKHHGEKSLVFSAGNCKIFVKTWSEIFTDFEIKHKFLLDKLNTDRAKIQTNASSTDEILQSAAENLAVQPEQFKMPLNGKEGRN